MKKILLVVVLLISAILFIGSNAYAGLSASAMGYFGGKVISYIPPYPPFCWSGYILYLDYASKVTNAVIPIPTTVWYKWYNPWTPGNYIIGQYSPVPLPEVCGIPVYPILKIGTSLQP